jgi:hypothetical protein
MIRKHKVPAQRKPQGGQKARKQACVSMTTLDDCLKDLTERDLEAVYGGSTSLAFPKYPMAYEE